MTDGGMGWGLSPTNLVEGARQFTAGGLNDARRHRAISPEAAAVIVHRLSEAPLLENAFRCGWDAATETITSATWLCRGTPSEVNFLRDDLLPFSVVVHNHPGMAESLTPSEVDVESAASLAVRSVGFAIVNNDLSQFLLVQPPRPSAVLEERKTWHLGPRQWGFTFSRVTLRRVFP